jgi:hypothetical protein
MSRYEIGEAAAESVLPLDGPYDPQRVIFAGDAIAELVRRLNHATQPVNTPQSLPYPSDAASLLAGLSSAAARLQQLIRQVSARVHQWESVPDELADDRGDLAERACSYARQCLTDAAPLAAQLHLQLQCAGGELAYLRVRTDT